MISAPPLEAPALASIGRAAQRGEPRPPLSDWIVPLVIGALVLILMALSDGFLEADEVQHFLIAQGVWDDWKTNLLSIWGRPACSGLYALGVPAGIVGARLLVVCVTMLTAIGGAKLARELLPRLPGGDGLVWRHRTALTWILLFAQPMVLIHSFTVMTEMLLACSWVWGVWFLARGLSRQGRGVMAACFIIGLGGLARPEGWIAIATVPVFLAFWIPGVRRLERAAVLRAIGGTFLAGLPVLVWYVAGVLAYGDLMWFRERWPWAPVSQYGKTLEHFVVAVKVSQAYWLWLPILVGTTLMWRRRRAFWLLAGPVFGLYLLHGVLGGFGLFGSLSMPRYFISIAPMAAVLAVGGLMAIEGALRRKWWSRIVIGAATAAALGTFLVLLAMHALPTRRDRQQRQIHAVVEELKRADTPEHIAGRMISSHPYLAYELGVSPVRFRLNWSRDPATYQNAPLGTLVMTDSTLWVNEHMPKLEDLESWGYRKLEDISRASDTVGVEDWDAIWLRDPKLRVAVFVKEK